MLAPWLYDASKNAVGRHWSFVNKAGVRSLHEIKAYADVSETQADGDADDDSP